MALSNKTYMEIVNRAITESKASLDELTAANFASPPRTILYSHFKNWVNDAYAELMKDRPEWFFRKERALITVYPRVFLTGVADTISVGDVLVGDDSDVEITVMGVYTNEEVEGNLEDEVTVSFVPTTPTNIHDLVRGETFSRTSPTSTAAIATLAGVGRYTFDNLVDTLEMIDEDSIRAHPLREDDTFGDLRSNSYPILPVKFHAWYPEYDMNPWTSGYTTYITQTDQGTYALYPQPSEAMALSFNYTRKITKMSAHDDVPEALPPEYQDYLIWKAVEEFADWDGNPKLFARAKKHLTKYETYLFRDKLPQMAFAPSRFNY